MSRTHLSIFISMCKPSLCSLSSSQTQSIDVQNKFHSQLTLFHSLCLSLPLSISILLYLYLYISHLLSLYLYYCISLSYYPSLSHSLIFPSLSPSVTLFLPLVSISLSHSLSLSSVTLFLPLSLSLFAPIQAVSGTYSTHNNPPTFIPSQFAFRTFLQKVKNPRTL